MQSTQTPTLIPLAFAANGTKNTIPEASQIGIVDGAASLNDGFPPLTRTPIAAGGKPPSGADMNGILYLVSAPIRWHQAGGKYGFNSAFAADTNVGGYPNGAELLSADMQGTWLSLIDNNTDNPDTGPGTNWVPGRAYGVTAISGLTNANVTLTPAQAAKGKITLAGTLTGNIQVIMPTWLREWTFVNNTTGSGSITVKTATGTGVVLAAGQQKLTGDGTNIVQPAESVAPATQAQHAVQKAQLGAYAAVKAYSASTTLTLSDINCAIDWFGPSGAILTLPVANTVSGSSSITIYNYGLGPLNITAQGSSDFIYYGANTTTKTITVQFGDSIVLLFRGNTEIDIVGGSGAFQFNPITIAPATQSQHAVQFGQVAGVVGSVRNLKMSVTAASASATFTADEIIVESALGGLRYCLASFNKTINLATTGAGGMDTGTAPVSGYVALYAIYNPATSTSALLGYNATSAVAPEVYGGGFMPSGYTASALVSVWPTNPSSKFVAGTQVGRTVTRPNVTVLSTTTTQASPTSLSVATAIPPNANQMIGSVGAVPNSGQAAGAAAVALLVFPDASGTGSQGLGSVAGGGNGANANVTQSIYTSQTIYYTNSISSGTSSFTITINGYSF